jgi:hypothetical protein
MYISGRIFVLTIASIFLSLGLGIVIGSAINNDMLITHHQDQIIRGLEKEFNTLRNETRVYKESLREKEVILTELNNQWEEIAFSLINGRLKNTNIGIITERGNDTKKMEKWLASSGANLLKISFTDKFFLNNPILFDNELSTMVKSSILDVVTNPSKNLTIEFYEGQGWLNIEGSLERAVDGIVIFGEKSINLFSDLKPTTSTLSLPMGHNYTPFEIVEFILKIEGDINSGR